MDGMTQSHPLPPALTEAVEAMVQERVVAALAGEKDNRMALMAKTDADAYARGYGQALTDLEAAWGVAMQGLWSGREKPAGWPWDGVAFSAGRFEAGQPQPPEPPHGTVVQLHKVGHGIVTPAMSDWDRALVEQGADAPGQRPPTEKPVARAPMCRDERMLRANHPDAVASANAIEVKHAVRERIATLPTATNLYGWPPAVLAVIRRQFPRFVTDREIQNEVEAILLETAPTWKINAQAKAMGLARAPMPRLGRGGTKVVEVTWHQAAMLARLYGQTFAGDMIALNQARLKDSRLPCRLTQPDGPTVADVDKYGPATL